MKKCRRAWFAFVAIVFLPSLLAQQTYQLPPKVVVDIFDAPPAPTVSVSPAGNRIAFIHYEANPSIAMMARPIAKLAGLRIDLALGARQRTTRFTKLRVEPIAGLEWKAVEWSTPADGNLLHVSWSPDGERIAFAVDERARVRLWIADLARGEIKPLGNLALNDVLGAPFAWAGPKTLLARLVPADRRAAPAAPAVPAGPNVEETSGRVSKVMTYQDLLHTTYDEELFEYFATSQLALVDVGTGVATQIGPPGMITSADLSPDDTLVLVSRLERPFSYRVPYSSFAHSVDVLDRAGKLVRNVARLPVADTVPPQGVPTGPRSVGWQPHQPATLTWAEALDGGDPLTKVPYRDRLVTLAAPFAGEPREILKVKGRFMGLTWGSAKGQALLSEFDRDRRWRTTSLIDVLADPITAKVIFDLSANDAYHDPGSPLMVTQPNGDHLMLQDGDAIYLDGKGASPTGERPFLDRLSLGSLEKKRLFESAADRHDAFVAFAGGTRDRAVISHESQTDPENWLLLNLADGKTSAITNFGDPAPTLKGMRKELVTYQRADGVPLSGTLCLPPGYQPGTRLPLFLWAYPLEYSDAGTAGQVRGSPNTFPRLTGASPLFFVTQGYAVLMDATMPVVGDPEHMNDTFIDQVVASAKAAIDKLDQMGVIDPKRCCVSGHSYGAFMTANLLAHSDLFAAGIARSGAYNRSLTPFGFQSERRSYWEATDLYTRMSPFTYANKINEPLLLIHGEADNNPGTHTIQSERLFQAIRGNGGTARLVLLPHEAHGYRSRESQLHVLAEMIAWADKYVKNAVLR